MIEMILAVMVFLTAMIPAMNKYLKAKIDVKFHVYLAYLTIIFAIISLFI